MPVPVPVAVPCAYLCGLAILAGVRLAPGVRLVPCGDGPVGCDDGNGFGRGLGRGVVDGPACCPLPACTPRAERGPEPWAKP